ncbi:hypothetical protein PM082_007279 [Marasmius tenuissimus]|nr:hypothetical protein PM082_007279 [Marasmius tenuissimus]
MSSEGTLRFYASPNRQSIDDDRWQVSIAKKGNLQYPLENMFLILLNVVAGSCELHMVSLWFGISSNNGTYGFKEINQL